eukprot:11150594-Lingulodinium_polyedra.AAC.1
MSRSDWSPHALPSISGCSPLPPARQLYPHSLRTAFVRRESGDHQRMADMGDFQLTDAVQK